MHVRVQCIESSSKCLTLGSLVSPLMGHSLKSSGALIEHTLACSTQGSLIMLTVKPFVARIFADVSLTRGPTLHEMDITAGEEETFVAQYNMSVPG